MATAATIADGVTLEPKKKQSTPSVRSVSFSQVNGTAPASSGDSAQHHSLNVKRTITTTTTTTKTIKKAPAASTNGVKKAADDKPKRQQLVRHPSKSSLNSSLKQPPAKRELSDAAKYARALKYGNQNLPSRGSVGVSTDDPHWAAHLATTSDLKVNLWTAGALRQAQDAASSSITHGPPKFWQPETDKESVSTAAEALRRSRGRNLFPEHKPDPDAAKWASNALSRSDSLIKAPYGGGQSNGGSKSAKADAHKGAVLAEAQADHRNPSRASSNDIIRAGGVGDLSKLQEKATENARLRLSAMDSNVAYYPINFPRDPNISEEQHRAAYIKEAAKRHADLLQVAKRKTDIILQQQDKDLVYQSLYHNRHFNEAAYALANERSSQRLANHGKVLIGGNVYMTQSEIDAIAERNVRPVIDEITEKAQEERQHQENKRQEREEQKRQENQRKAEREALKRERKESERNAKQAAKETERQAKAERKKQSAAAGGAKATTTTGGGAAVAASEGGAAAETTKKEPSTAKPVVDPRTAPGPGAGHPHPLITSTLLLEPDGNYIKPKDPKILEQEKRELEEQGKAEANEAASEVGGDVVNDDAVIDKNIAEQGEKEAKEAASAALDESYPISGDVVDKEIAQQGDKEASEAASAALGEDYSASERILDKNIAEQGETEASEAASVALGEDYPTSGKLLDKNIAEQGEKEADDAATAAIHEPKPSGKLLDKDIAEQGEKEADDAATAAIHEPKPSGLLLDPIIAQQGEKEADEAADEALAEYAPPAHDQGPKEVEVSHDKEGAQKQHPEEIEVSDDKADDAAGVVGEPVVAAVVDEPAVVAAVPAPEQPTTTTSPLGTAVGATAGVIAGALGATTGATEEAKSSSEEYTTDDDDETSSEGEEETSTGEEETSSEEEEDDDDEEEEEDSDANIDPTAANPAQAVGQTVSQLADDVKRNVSAFREHITE